MNSHLPLVVDNLQIRRDGAGRYCLNDLHQASGGAKRHQPANWLRLQQTTELIAEVGDVLRSEEAFLRSEERDEPLVVLQGGFTQGTYAIKELVYAYAMWISPRSPEMVSAPARLIQS
ncbi:KilA-N domain-containing protein [Xanthomonas cassavae CFBP 4642]|uniref:KilA-N domain-containing protein n=1 Tax=Xanthomonas cassavae CFBP 4642 TaxID=1219375 RepID=A0ABS8HKS8_9XANT|nr:KilA-N domain-containing protein [Xanthomonas cassavae]MCC4622227.1 KilA-N domain-containing protein [Xanthomonas cassavae CFBP 4642]